jgi:hypothetical protein
MHYFWLGVFGLVRLSLLLALWWGWRFMEARIDFLNASKVHLPGFAIWLVGLATCLTYFSLVQLVQKPQPKRWHFYLGTKSFEILGWLVLAVMAAEPIFRTVIALDRTDVKIIGLLMLLGLHLVGLLLAHAMYKARQK